MALVSCSECGKQVSTEAAACPSCGAPVTGALRSMQGMQAGGARSSGSAGTWGKVAAAIGAWLVVPWLVRGLAFVAGIVMLIVMFRSAR